jgi:uncharacterized protein YebE (UPF0316 family)
MRIIFITRGQKVLAPLLGFFELLVWLFALRVVMTNLNNVGYYVMFAGGFAAGTFIGLYIEEKLALGTRIIRVVTRRDATALIEVLRADGHGVTSIDAEGGDGAVHVLFSIVKRRDLARYIQRVREFNPRALYSIQNVDYVNSGIFAARESFVGRSLQPLRRSGAKVK